MANKEKRQSDNRNYEHKRKSMENFIGGGRTQSVLKPRPGESMNSTFGSGGFNDPHDFLKVYRGNLSNTKRATLPGTGH